MISQIGQSVIDTVQAAGQQVTDTVFGAPIRLGVTGLARSGKTVFITSLVANLLAGGRMPQLAAFAKGRVELAYLHPQPDDTMARFDYETHLSALTGPTPIWPENTKGISQLRLTLRLKPDGIFSALRGRVVQHIDIIDYPGEWLLDLTLLNKSYEDWSKDALTHARARDIGHNYVTLLDTIDPTQEFRDIDAKALSSTYAAYLEQARQNGFPDLTPGRFLLPGDLAGSPVITFGPLPANQNAGKKTLYREMARRYEAYKAKVVRPFFRDHFSQIDRQIVLIDMLDALENGPQATRDLRNSLIELMQAFRTGRNSILSRLFLGNRVEKILFAATKADHIPQSQHSQMTSLIQAFVDDATRRAKFSGAETASLAIASLRSTTETRQSHAGKDMDFVRGTDLDTREQVAFYPGQLPDNPQSILSEADQSIGAWSLSEFSTMRFAPPKDALRSGEGMAHIRLDQAAQFLLGDRL
ncbi:MAG: YcjX family protein [Paracoccaceae bacterium]